MTNDIKLASEAVKARIEEIVHEYAIKHCSAPDGAWSQRRSARTEAVNALYELNVHVATKQIYAVKQLLYNMRDLKNRFWDGWFFGGEDSPDVKLKNDVYKNFASDLLYQIETYILK